VVLGRGNNERDDMDFKEAKSWLNNERSMTNLIPSDPQGTLEVRIAQADAAMIQQAYWIMKAHIEGLLNSNGQ